jgi:hypothetical protein
MSRKERDRMTIMTGVKRQELTLVQAGELMAVCYRQSKRIWRRYRDDGDAGLVHRLRGKPSVRGKPPELRAQALARYTEERYADFGLTLMAEHLAKEKLVVDHETLRRWRLAEGAAICQAEVRRRMRCAVVRCRIPISAFYFLLFPRSLSVVRCLWSGGPIFRTPHSALRARQV